MGELGDLPLFPLPRTTLLPGMTAPLYIFEPRYRDLLSRVSGSGEPFGIVRVRPRRGENGGPALGSRISAVGSLAWVVACEPHEDGSSSVVVRGGERFRVVRLRGEHAYLSADVRLEPPPPGEGWQPRLNALCAHLIASGHPCDPQRGPDEVVARAVAIHRPAPDALHRLLLAPTLADRLDSLLETLPQRQLH